MRHTFSRQRSGLVLASLASLLSLIAVAPAYAGSERALAELRVEGETGTIDPGTWYVTGPEKIKRATGADDCVARSGSTLFPGPTALSIVGTAGGAGLGVVRYRDTDFGPQLCQIGSAKSFGHYPNPSGGFLYWVNYVSGFSSPDTAPVESGDSVLWYYAVFPADPPGPSDPVVNTGNPLELTGVPARDQDGEFTVHVDVHDFDGTPNAVSDADILGADTVTPEGNGYYAVTVNEGFSTLTAVRDPDVPSNHVEVCFRDDVDTCPVAHGKSIVGSGAGDKIKGTRGYDDIRTRGGKDRINITRGGRDLVNCGGGKDVVIVKRNDGDHDTIFANCEEKVRR